MAPWSLASIPRHVFYDRLNELLDEVQFDKTVEGLCEEYNSQVGRDSIHPGRYFRMLFAGYFEDIDSQRGIAWRCSDSLSLRRFLFLAANEESPDHSSLTKIRKRLPLSVHEHVFAVVLQIAQEKKLLKGGTVGVDSTMLEANAAMKSIVWKDSGEDWKAYLQSLAEAEGATCPQEWIHFLSGDWIGLRRREDGLWCGWPVAQGAVRSLGVVQPHDRRPMVLKSLSVMHGIRGMDCRFALSELSGSNRW